MTMAETQVESGASGSGGGGASGGTGGGGGAGPPDAVVAAPLLHLHANNNHPLATNNNHHRATAKRKRKRLSQVVDKLATQVSSGPATALPPLNNNFHHHNHNHKELDLLKLVKSEPEDDALAEEAPEPRALKASKTLAAAVVAAAAAAAAAAAGAGVGRSPVEGAVPPKEEPAADVFRFDSTDRERYLFNAISEEDEAEDVFSPASSSNKSPHSSNTDSPKISFSPLRLKDSSVEDELDGAASCTPPSSGRSAGGSSGGGTTAAAARGPHGPGEDAPRYPGCACAHCASATDRFFPASPISPLTPVSPSPAPIYHFEHYLHTKYLPDIFRRRSHSDSDLPMWFEGAKAEGGTEAGATQAAAAAAAAAVAGGRARHPPQPLKLPTKGGSLESETSTPQDSPLDLSMKGSRERVGSSTSSESVPPPTPGFDPVAAAAAGANPAALQLQLLTPGFLPPGKTGAAMPVPVVKGDVASPTTKESVAVRYNLEVSPVVEEMPPGSDVAYVCPVCGQMFSLHDRLAKHMASRHKSRAQQPDQTSKAYLCEICKRSFARSDMLTRHMRLHTGVKPYTCRICGQVFSRSDHLSTHQRTHTGEKPYRCPQCPYAACRRDMITRHMRTHARYEPGAERPERGRRGRRGGRGRGRGRGDAAAGPPPPAEVPPEMTDPSVGLDDMGDLPLSDDLLPPDCISPEPPLSPAQALVGGVAMVAPMDTGGHDGD